MRKTEKINILNELIEETSKLEYRGDNISLKAIIDKTLSFIRNASLAKANESKWMEKLDEIKASLAMSAILRISDASSISHFKNWESDRKDLLKTLDLIKDEIERYTPDEIEQISDENSKNDDNPIIFLSHSSSDKSYGDALEKFITGLGLKNDQLIYTSHPLHKIPLDANIYEYLRKNINRKIFMIILWSDKYLDSPACLNEMGAAWVTQCDYTNIYTPKFQFGNPKYRECAVDTQKMGAVLGGDDHCKANMIELKNKILSMFGLEVDEKATSYLLDNFVKEIMEIAN
jgi:hypothetical protein